MCKTTLTALPGVIQLMFTICFSTQHTHSLTPGYTLDLLVLAGVTCSKLSIVTQLHHAMSSTGITISCPSW
ncbi:hypothetical protein VFPPC_15426 [Pochonia chlamydosporia 170]|uniref:Uncharacterized protein n=1 Tax=Pochonia chlamydosporia 170 TaxID=1380566 RepID=A0A179G8R4_METCM|nr:hypothetical protein VFPPC_15426 [Pochonia chlamydosporia 170]OAQ74197.1 hypothetical protein VFPPC_15426 [Pochonia chlamydosporia 170]